MGKVFVLVIIVVAKFYKLATANSHS